jgi:serine protease Do
MFKQKLPKSKTITYATLVGVALCSLVIGLVVASRLNVTPLLDAITSKVESGKKNNVTPTEDLRTFVQLAKEMKPVAVNISTTKVIKQKKLFRQQFRSPFGEDDPFRDFFGDDFFDRFFGEMPREYKQRSLGSGFIIDEDGYILTNNHVVEGADEIKVKLSDKHEFDAKVVGRDQKTDIALIKIKSGQGLPIAKLGDSDKLEVGEWVMAIGNPFGLEQTVTVGIVSAKGRVIGSGPYDDFIQTDASINPGNSGGPLINVKGEVVGINAAIIAGGQGIGFAIPINMAKSVIAQLKDKGKVTRGWLGVVVQAVTPDLAKSFGLKEGKGALVAEATKGGPAEEAGIEQGDVIVEFDGKEISEMNTLPRLVAETPVGKKVKVVVLRNGAKKELTVKIGELSEEKEQEIAAEKEADNLGLVVSELTPEIADHLNVPAGSGVVVTDVVSGSSADEGGIRRGDIIKEVNRQPVKNMKGYNQVMKKAIKAENILLLIKRGKNSIYVILKP